MHLLIVVALCIALPQSEAPRFGSESADRGLPRDPRAFAPYHEDPEHLLNRVFRATWLVDCAPAEVAAVLPREHGEESPFTAGWVHRKRAGTGADRRWFGGDGIQLPLESLAPERAVELARMLDEVGEAHAAMLARTPELAVLFQYDLLRVAQRLLDAGANPELLPKLLRAANAVALSSEQLAKLRGTILRLPLDEPSRSAVLGPAEAEGTKLREILRRSTRLFDAERTLLWSRVWLAHPEGPDALRALLPDPSRTDAKEGPTVPVGFEAVLVQGVVAFDREGRPHATSLVTDVRTQRLVHRGPLAPDDPTFTKDGIDFTVHQLQREALRRDDPATWFRRVDPDDQELFRDYGTLKHTTYRAQCSLCHRNTETPEPNLGGFPVLRPHAGARLAETGAERLRLAEEQAAKLLERLSAAR